LEGTFSPIFGMKPKEHEARMDPEGYLSGID